MRTKLSIEGDRFLINGHPTYEGRSYRGMQVEGRLFNSRMVQAVFDDACRETCDRWIYPDTGVWDPNRNTAEFCAMLPTYRRAGLLAVTVGLQGGGSIYAPAVYDFYRCSAFGPHGDLDPAYFDRLHRILAAADAVGMIVIVSLFYRPQLKIFENEAAVVRAMEGAADWMLASGFENLMVELVNEACVETGPYFDLESIPQRLRQFKSVRRNGRRLLVGNSRFPDKQVPPERWLDEEDVSLIHANGCLPHQAKKLIRDWKGTASVRKRPRPLVVNEDSPLVANLEAVLEEGASWGFYHQGFGSAYKHDLVNFNLKPREREFEYLSGFQTVPVNWSINDPWKKDFFTTVARVTGSEFHDGLANG